MKGIVGLALASTLLLVGCYTGPSASHFVAVVDELNVPPDWEVVETVVRGPNEAESCSPSLSNECPAAIRTYLTKGDEDAAYAQAKDVIVGSGFSITEEATAGCASSSNGPACSYFAHRGDDRLLIQVFTSPSAAGVEVDTPAAAAVVVHASSSN